MDGNNDTTSQAAKRLGRLGGLALAYRRTAQERSDMARHAAQARWRAKKKLDKPQAVPPTIRRNSEVD